MMEKGWRSLAMLVVSACCGLLVPAAGWAHCDTMSGPVVVEAKAALEKGDVTPILKWVKPENETEVKVAFAKAVAVRGKGPEAKEIADRYFLETLVRLHRAGEGEPYTGLKDEPVEPIVAMADKSIADGSAREITGEISRAMAAAIDEKLEAVLDAAKRKDTSVEAGRRYVEAYVTYLHHVEGIHAAVASAGEHGHRP